MSRRPARFTQADIHRAIKGMMQAGEEVTVVFKAGGDIVIAASPANSGTRTDPVENRPRRVP